ncbi:hypothetical protein K503DRAFT_774778 [Rhizopogon vinicolor AM-OR11-026]|uniref:Uncharacterized protein n=1 Tax=Rhizopogon vinicolor AM-OR11-026 TaxID=1314800 RepID=A0A1B7MNP7_9AGAM|nr:hypothetical protein K503DRAFT_774778 [Rhizopogon vinicolor AM-OR11-026]
MSSPFSVPSSTVNNPNNSTNNVPFQIPPNFGMSYNYMATMHGPNTQQQQQQQHQQFFPMLPPGKNDLEVLENLKTIIKEGQHEFYRAIPQPAALASLYLGPTAPQSAAYHSPYNSPPQDSNTDPNRRPTDPVLKDAWKATTTLPNVLILAVLLLESSVDYLF